ncbi:hypothetical protein [Halorubrum sp. HHNYT27]|uniref:hypothetical protein n=1 Tax=Halorubrum sp. HHNYT27 TaxID=3402275 RepID=UPI003EBE8A2D
MIGPVIVGSTRDVPTTEAGFLLAAGFVAFAATLFGIRSRRAATTAVRRRPTEDRP